MLLARDDPDAMLAGITPNPPASVAFVPNDAVQATLGAAWSRMIDTTSLQELFECVAQGEEAAMVHAIALVCRCDHTVQICTVSKIS